ncbi:MAG: chromate transporter [Lachnospiraceae bacterium]|nr:chromate transporter [Lachnospiraceae bacterium]
MKKYIDLFITMLKIGLFTFGGGYAMIALLENEFVSHRKWIEKNEFLDMVAIVEI